MKFITLFRMSSKGMAVLPDSVGLPSWRPLFVPDFAVGGVAVPMMALKIGRLGKCVETRFASRYIAATAPAIQILSSESAQCVRGGVTPPQALLCFDNAVVCGEFTDYRDNPDDDAALSGSIRYRFRTSRAEDSEIERSYDKNMSEMAVELSSRYNTIKTGDVILLPASSYIDLTENLVIEAYAPAVPEGKSGMCEKLLLHSKIK